MSGVCSVSVVVVAIAGVATSAPTARTTAGASVRVRIDVFFTEGPFIGRDGVRGQVRGSGGSPQADANDVQ